MASIGVAGCCNCDRTARGREAGEGVYELLMCVESDAPGTRWAVPKLHKAQAPVAQAFKAPSSAPATCCTGPT
jgi:hypothetical protein